MTNTIGATPEERELIETVATKIYANLHHLMRVTGNEAQEAYTQAAQSIVESLISDRAREDAEWLPTVRYCIDQALSGEPTRDSLLNDLRNLRTALNTTKGQSNGE